MKHRRYFGAKCVTILTHYKHQPPLTVIQVITQESKKHWQFREVEHLHFLRIQLLRHFLELGNFDFWPGFQVV